MTNVISPSSGMREIEKRAFGRTALQVSAIGWGAAEIGFQNTPDATVDRLLAAILDAGINVIDTAECYLDSEEKLGKVLGPRRKQLLLFTKCGHADQPRQAGLVVRGFRKLLRPAMRATGLALPDWHPRLLERSIDRSLQRLRTDWIDLIQLHSCSEEILRRGEVIEVLDRARRAGKARYIGYSGDGNAAVYAVQCGRFDALQISFNLADQQPLDLVLPLAVGRGLGVIAKRPVANGVWRNETRPANSYQHVYWDRLRTLGYDSLQQRLGGMEAALRFTLSAPGVHTAIVGTTNADHCRVNAAFAAAGPLDIRQFEAIRARWKEVAQPDWVGQQ